MSEEFWDIVNPLVAAELLEEGTIMGTGCARAKGEFVAMPYHKGDGLVVKLPKGRVDELVDGGVGKPFAPAGKVFKEWVLVEEFDENHWDALIRESITFVLS